MNTQQLESFIKIAQYGSFSQAANALYITPSAIIQQINNLEKSLQVSLFYRTKKGVTLTPAGEFLLRESQELIEKTRRIENGLSRFRSEEKNSICVGTSLLHKCRIFESLWKSFKETHPDCQVTMKPLSFKGSMDLVESVQDGQSWQKYMEFLPLIESPLVCAVPLDHPLAGRERLTVDDLRSTPLVTISHNLSAPFARFTHEMQANGIQVIEVSGYDMSVFSLCQTNGYLLQIPYIWKDLYQSMKAIPCDWNYSLPYGFFYRKNASSTLQEFIHFATQWKEIQTKQELLDR